MRFLPGPPERTGLAWTRTSLTIAALAALVARLGAASTAGWLALALPIGLTTSAGLIAGLHRAAELRRPDLRAAGTATMLAVTGAVVTGDVAALVVVLLR